MAVFELITYIYFILFIVAGALAAIIDLFVLGYSTAGPAIVLLVIVTLLAMIIDLYTGYDVSSFKAI